MNSIDFKYVLEKPYRNILMGFAITWVMSYLLLKGKTKVVGETALMLLSYNLRRAISIKGVEDLVKALV